MKLKMLSHRTKSIHYLLMHYGCRTALGTELQTSLELLVVDLGLSFQPFQVSYEHFGDWVTTSWLKRVWEKVSFFGFTLSVRNLPACYPREGDDWLMSRFIARGYTANELATLNRVRKHQQVLFLSDILGVGGGSVDKRYLQKRRAVEYWSSMKFPREVVTAPEMELWCRAIMQVVSDSYDPLTLLKLIEKLVLFKNILYLMFPETKLFATFKPLW